MRSAQKFLQDLGGTGAMDEMQYLSKPKWMRCPTYHRLKEQLVR
jgi:hypothetical protein